MPSFHQACDRASHHAIGVPTSSRMIVAVAASSMVSRIAVQISGDSASNDLVRALYLVSVSLDDGRGFRASEERHEAERRVAGLALLQQHCILPDRCIQVLRHHPLGTGFVVD